MGPFRNFWDSSLATLGKILVTNGLILLSGLLTGIITARLLGPGDRGTLAAIFLWPQIFAAVGLLSINDAVLVKLAGSTGHYLAASVQLALVLAGITVAAGLLALPWLLRSSQGALGTGSLFLAFYVPANVVALVLLASEQARGNYDAFNLFRLFGPGVYLAGICFLATSGLLTVPSAAAASLVGNVAVAIALLVRQRSAVSLTVSRNEVRHVVRGALPIHATSLLAIATSQMDRVAVAALFEPHAIGLYAVAITVSGSLLSAIGTTAQTYLIPEVSRESSFEGRREWISRGLGVSWCALMATGFVLAAVCPFVIPLVFGDQYREAIVPSMVSVIASVLFATRQVVVRSLGAVGKNRPGHGAESAALLTFCMLAVACKKSLGLQGIAWSLLGANVLSLAFCALQLRRCLQIAPLEWLLPNPMKIRNAQQRWTRRAVAS